MGSVTRGKFPHLIDDLYRASSHYEAFQALYLLEQSLDGLNPEEEIAAVIDLAPSAALTFPTGEIRQLAPAGNGKLRVELSSLGLYGTSSPLPQFFNDIASRDCPGNQELRSFLEMFNRRLYLLAYLGWKKLNRAESSGPQSSLICRYLDAISGYAELNGRNDYSGILGGRVKGAQALRDLLADFLGYKVVVQQNVAHWISVEERTGLGNTLALGDNCFIGSRILDVSSQIRIEIGPLSFKEAENYFPQGEKAVEINEMIRKYIDPAIEVSLILLIQPEATRRSRLGDKNVLLGWTTCLGTCAEKIHRLNLNIRQPSADVPVNTADNIDKRLASAA